LQEATALIWSQKYGVRILEGYGATECSPCVSLNTPLEPRYGSVGRLMPGMAYRLEHVEGVEDGGRLFVRGPNVMKGYLNRPDETAATLLAGGWLRTGDIASFDAEGFLYIVDRVKELIKYNAYQIAPAELEAVLVSHPAVAEAAVIPSPDEEYGEVPKAFVVLKSAATPEDLMEFVATRVAPFKKVRKLDIVDAIPKSPAGKLLRRVLVEQERSRRL